MMTDQTHISLTKISHMATPDFRGGGGGAGYAGTILHVLGGERTEIMIEQH